MFVIKNTLNKNIYQMLNINVIHTQYITVFMLIILKPVIKFSYQLS